MPLIIKKQMIFKSVLLFTIFFILASSPAIKNKILFNIFANSSWTGLNAAQSTGYDRQNWPLCSFSNENIEKHNLSYKKMLGEKNYLNQKILNDKSFNDLGYIYKSKKCSNVSKKFLIKIIFFS